MIMHHPGRTIATPDGLNLFVRDLPADGAEVGPPVICLHGLTRNSRDFDQVQARIAAGGRRALALDVRGRGLSDRDAAPERYNPAIYAQDVIHVLKALSIEEAAFVGTSMGGIIAMVVAMLAPDMIERTALNDVGPELDPAGLARIAGYVGKTAPAANWAEATASVRGVNSCAFPGADETFFAMMAQRQYREGADGRPVPDYDPAIAQAFQAPEGAAPLDMWPLFDALAAKPMLVVRGAISDLLAPETVGKMRARKADLFAVEQPGVGHAPFLDEPASWAALSAFLRLRAA